MNISILSHTDTVPHQIINGLSKYKMRRLLKQIDVLYRKYQPENMKEEIGREFGDAVDMMKRYENVCDMLHKKHRREKMKEALKENGTK